MCVKAGSAILWLAASATTLNAASELDQGRAIAEAHCGVCHAVGVADESPSAVNADTPFRRLHERFPIAMLQEAQKTGSISGHDEMPGFDFSLEEIEALLVYIDSLSPENARYIKAP